MAGWNVHVSAHYLHLLAQMGRSPYFWDFMVKKRPFLYLAVTSLNPLCFHFQSIWHGGKNVLQSVTSPLLLDQSAMPKAILWKGLWECMPCLYHGKEVGCFLNQTNKHLLRPCIVCKAWWEIIKLSKTWYLTSRSLQPCRGNETKTQF